MNIAIFSDSYLPVLNGVSISVRTLVEGLRSRGHRVWVLAPAFPKHCDCDEDVIRFRSVMTPFAKGYPLAVPPFGAPMRALARHPVDLVHTHTPFTVGYCGLRWARSHGKPIVSTYHTLYDRYIHYAPWFCRWYAASKVAKHTRYYYNSVAKVITPSEVAAKVLRKHGVFTDIQVIRTGIPDGVPIPRPQAREQLGISGEELCLLYVGRLAIEKNLDLLVGVMERLRTSVPEARLRFVGNGPGRPALERRVREAGLQESVVFHGEVPHDRVRVFMAVADLFVFPSTTETQGIVIGEAQSMGLPTIAVAGGGAPEMVKHEVDGFVVPDSVEPFAEAVERLARDPELRARMSEHARRSDERITPEEYVSRVIGVYEEVLGASK